LCAFLYNFAIYQVLALLVIRWHLLLFLSLYQIHYWRLKCN